MKRAKRTRAEEAADKYVARVGQAMFTEHRCIAGSAYHDGFKAGYRAAQQAARKKGAKK